MPYLPPDAVREALERQQPRMVAMAPVPTPHFQHPMLQPPQQDLQMMHGLGEWSIDGKSVLIGALVVGLLGALAVGIHKALN